MTDLKQEISKIIGVRVEDGHLEDIFKSLDRSGKLTNRILVELIILILKKLDEKGTL